MSTELTGLVVDIEARTKKLEQGLKRANDRQRRAAAQMERTAQQSARKIEQTYGKMSDGIGRRLKGLAGPLAGLLSAREMGRMADSWTDYSARVGLAIGSMDAAPAVMQRLYTMAQRTYSGLEETAEGYLAFSTSLREVGLSANESLDFVEAFNNAMVVSGAKAQRAEAVQNALAKAMASGTLQGDNLNTVIQTGGRLAELLAEHFGTTVGGLREVGKEGKITGKVIKEVLADNLERLTAEAEAMPATISDGFLKIRNAAMQWVGTMDQASGASAKVAGALEFVADNFDAVATGGMVAAGALMSRYVPALARATVAQAAMIASNPFLLAATAIGAAAGALVAFGDDLKVVEGEAAGLNDYLGVAFTTLKDLAGDAARYTINAFGQLTDYIVSAFEGVGVEWDEVTGFIYSAINKVIGFQMALHKTAVAVFTQLPAAIADGVIRAINFMIEKVTDGLNFVIDRVNDVREAMSGWSIAGMEITGAFEPIQHLKFDGLTNSFEGAIGDMGTALADARDAVNQDWLGAGADAASGFFQGWRNAANQRAEDRATAEATRQAALGGILDATNPVAGGGGGGGAGGGAGGRGRRGGGGRGQLDDFTRELASIRDRTAALRVEAEVMAQVANAHSVMANGADFARAKIDLLNAAKKAGVKVTPELIAKIDELAESYARASEEAKKNAEAVEKAADAQGRAVGRMTDLAKAGIRDGKEGLARELEKMADEILGQMLQQIFSQFMSQAGQMASMQTGGGGGGGGGNAGAMIAQILMSLFGFSSGGYTGPGGKYEPAGVVHKGEFVMSKAATQRIGVANLEGLHQRALKGYSAGGLVDGPASLGQRLHTAPNAAQAAPAPVITLSPTINVNASGGSPEQNADLARQISQETEKSMRGLIRDELVRQARPGGLMAGVLR